MGRYWLAAVALLCVCALGAAAQEMSERQVKAAPGRDNRIAVYTNILPDCTSGPLPVIRLVAPPAHGAVTVKRGTLKATNFKQCLATEVPVFVALYRPTDGFSGIDEFDLEIGLAGGRKQRQHFRVNVSASPGGGRGI
jgi:hypothetical protein